MGPHGTENRLYSKEDHHLYKAAAYRMGKGFIPTPNPIKGIISKMCKELKEIIDTKKTTITTIKTRVKV